MKPAWCYLNGNWFMHVDLRKDLALWRGVSVFEAMEARGDIIFHWEDHYRRLLKSCERSYIPSEDLPKKDDLLNQIRKNLRFFGHAESVVKILVSRGDSINHWKPSDKAKLFIDAFPLDKTEKPPFKLTALTALRSFPEMKGSGLYQQGWILREDAKKRGFDDFLFWDPGPGIIESCLANIFFVTDSGGLLTPGSGILYGVTRRIILDLARREKIFDFIDDKSGIHFAALDGCSEAFLTSTTLGAAPIEIIDGRRFKTSPKNRYTKKVQKLFLKYRENYYKERGA